MLRIPLRVLLASFLLLSVACGQRFGVSDGGTDAGQDAGSRDAGTDAGAQDPVETTLTAGPSGTVNVRTATFEFGASIPGSTFECALDLSPFAACTSPRTHSNVGDGDHTFQVRAIDPAGAADVTPATRSWSVDATAPSSSITSGPPPASDAGTAQLQFTADDATAQFECRTNDGGYAGCSSPSLVTLSDGTHRFDIRAVDTVGNVEASPSTWTWRIDLVPPETAITSAPTGTINVTSASVSFSANEAVSRFECRVGATAFATCTSPHPVTGMSDGAYTFEVRAVDEVLHTDPIAATASWQVDSAIPETTILTTPDSVTQSTSAAFSFEANRAGSTFECKLNAGTYAACVSPATYTMIEGSHTFSVRAVHTAGTDPSAATYSWRVDLTPPSTTITAKPPATHSANQASFSFTSNETATFECTFDGGTPEPCTSPKLYTGLAETAHTFSVVAIDAVGLRDASPATATFTVNLSAVKIRVVASNLTSGAAQSYQLEGTRILDGLDPDIVLIQEFNIDSSLGPVRTWVDNTFGVGFAYFRERDFDSSDSIGNGVISRYPIIAAGEWTQFGNTSSGSNRDYVWARIDIPGPIDLWVVSVHLKASSGFAAQRGQEAQEIVSYVNANVPTGAYLLVGGDFNTYNRTEAAITTLSQIVVTASPHPADQSANGFTNAGRTSPYDWVLADADLDPLETSVVIGSSTFANGLVFDSRVYTPLSDVGTALQGDSGATNMQHMAVVRDFLISQ